MEKEEKRHVAPPSSAEPEPVQPNEAEAEFFDLQRRELLLALSGKLYGERVPQVAWAFLWLSDLDKLKELLQLFAGAWVLET